MGEEEKKPEEKKVEGEGKKEEPKKQEGGEEKKKEEGKKEEGKKEGDGGEKKAEGGGEGEKKESLPPPPPPEEIIMRVFMHCEGCARKVKRSLKGFPGVEMVTTDCRTHKVVVKGKSAAADPLKVVDRVEKKSGRKVELLTPIPPKPEEKKEEKKEEDKPKPEEKKEEPKVIAVVLKVHMHCEACLQEIKKRILKMKGVQSVDPDLKSSEVTVKGIFEPAKLVEYIYKRTGKHAAIVKTEPAEKKDEKPEEKKPDGGEGEKDKKDGGGEGEKEKKEGGGEGEKKEGGGADPPKDGGAAAVDEAAAAVVAAAAKLGELTKNPLLYYYPKYQVEYAYPPQIFSDENPNACSVM